MDAHVPSTRPQCIWVQFLWWNISVIYVVTGNKVDLPNLVHLSVNYLDLSDNCVDLSDLHLTCVPWNSCSANKSIAWQTGGRTIRQTDGRRTKLPLSGALLRWCHKKCHLYQRSRHHIFTSAFYDKSAFIIVQV